MNQDKIIPKPSKKEVDKYLKEWDKLSDYVQQEKTLEKLFKKTYPKNNNMEEVLVKVCVLNEFYSTRMPKRFIMAIAKRIVYVDIDNRLKNGCHALVGDIAEVEGKIKENQGKETTTFYSFATKYCSFHFPEKYRIYDSYVMEMLIHFQSTDGFFNENKEKLSDAKELRCYQTYRKVMDAFYNYYKIANFSPKDIDRYLWLAGQKHFPKKKTNAG